MTVYYAWKLIRCLFLNFIVQRFLCEISKYRCYKVFQFKSQEQSNQSLRQIYYIFNHLLTSFTSQEVNDEQQGLPVFQFRKNFGNTDACTGQKVVEGERVKRGTSAGSFGKKQDPFGSADYFNEVVLYL